MRAYSEDLRKKIVAAIERGMPKTQAARLFDVSLSLRSKGRALRRERPSGSAPRGEPLGESPSHPEKKSPGRPRKAEEKARALPEESGRYVFGAARPRISNTSVPSSMTLERGWALRSP